MNDDEKYQRCLAARHKPSIVKSTGNCVVYGRTVGSCADCAFSYWTRPMRISSLEDLE